jgi:hypothetical protein
LITSARDRREPQRLQSGDVHHHHALSPPMNAASIDSPGSIVPLLSASNGNVGATTMRRGASGSGNARMASVGSTTSSCRVAVQRQQTASEARRRSSCPPASAQRRMPLRNVRARPPRTDPLPDRGVLSESPARGAPVRLSKAGRIYAMPR